MDDKNAKPQDELQEEKQDSVSKSRRRLVLVTAPVILGVANRPAWANVCSISGMYSGPISGAPEVSCSGLTPGFWKNHPEDWPFPYEPDTAGSSSSLSVIQEEKQKRLKERWPKKSDEGEPGDGNGTRFNDVFPNARAYIGLDYNITLMEAVALEDKSNSVSFGHTLGAHIVSGLFNTGRFGVGYGYSSMQQYIDKVELFFATNPTNAQQEVFKNELVMLNERGE